eukprot:749811-Hanusia_phi.AAC.1
MAAALTLYLNLGQISPTLAKTESGQKLSISVPETEGSWRRNKAKSQANFQSSGCSFSSVAQNSRLSVNAFRLDIPVCDGHVVIAH